MIFPLTIIIIFLASILSVTALPYLSIYGFAPDLLFIAIIICSLSEDYKRFLVCNFFAAIFYGLLSSLPLSSTLPSFFISITLSNILFRYYFGGFNYFVILIYAAVTFALFKLMEITFLYFENYALMASLFNMATLKLIIIQIFFNSFFIMLILQFLKKLKIMKQIL